MTEGKTGQHGKPEDSRWRAFDLAHVVGEAVEARDQFGTFLVILGTDLRKLHRPRAAVEQRSFYEFLELLDALGNHGIGYTQLTGGLDEARCLRDPDERLDAQETIHRLPPKPRPLGGDANTTGETAPSLALKPVEQLGRLEAAVETCAVSVAT